MYTLIILVQDLLFIGIFIAGCVKKQWELLVLPIICFGLVPFMNELIYNIFAKILFSPSSHRISTHKHFDSLAQNTSLLPIFYHPRYNVTACGIEKIHPFDSVKYGRIFDMLKQCGLVSKETIIAPQGKIGRGLMLSLGVSPIYLLTLNYSFFISKYMEIPLCFLPASLLRWRALDPMMFATQGTIDAAVFALARGWSINLSGGYHHAYRQSGGGFCIYPDICLAIEHLRQFFSVKKCMIVDLDAHQGNGHERDFLDDRENTFIFDFYNHRIYPFDQQAKKAISYSEDVNMSTSDTQYLDMLKQGLVASLNDFKPEFLLYNAGTDCLHGDQLGRMNLSEQCIIERDYIVFQECLVRSIPLTMVLSGGYQQINAQIIANSIVNLENKLNLSNYNLRQKTFDLLY